MTYLLDSNTCSHIHRGTPAVAIRLASLTRPAALYLSVVVQGELLYGACHAPRAMRAKLLRGIRPVLGRVAATALEEDLILVSDDAHFERVSGLRVANWVR